MTLTTLQLLLILSAMLSALTGALGGRAPDLRAHQTAVVREAVPAVLATAQSTRPQAALPSLAMSAAPLQVSVFAPAPAVPLHATRRRE